MKEEERQKIIYEIAMGRVSDGWSFNPNMDCWQKGKSKITANEVSDMVGDYTCAICGSGPDGDIRGLRISCFYDLTEVSNKFRKVDDFYVLSFCKPCRGHFMSEILGKWVESKGHLEHPNWNGEATIQYV